MFFVDQVSLNTHLIHIHFQLFFSSSIVISQRWRSDSFDNSGPRGVNTKPIAPLRVFVCSYLAQHSGTSFYICIFTESERQIGYGGKNNAVSPKATEYVPIVIFFFFLLLFTICSDFNNIKTLFLANCHFHDGDEKMSNSHKRA